MVNLQRDFDDFEWFHLGHLLFLSFVMNMQINIYFSLFLSFNFLLFKLHKSQKQLYVYSDFHLFIYINIELII